jgi:hypothetical protein
MKYPMKLWPLRPATRAGQNAIAIQMIAIRIHHKINMSCPPAFRAERCYVLLNCSSGTGCSPGSDHRCTPRFPGEAVDR